MLATALALILPNHAAADLVGHEEVRAAVAGKTDDVLIARNPLLKRLARDNPALLREALQRLRVQTPSHRRSFAMGQPERATATESAILTANADFAELYRESPEAALDLLRLIREAAGSQ